MNNTDLKNSNYFVSSSYEIVNSTTGRALKQKTTKAGYKSVCLYLPDGKKTKFVHRLIAQAFIYNPLNLPEINHLDGNKSNNVPSNFEWCTRKQNVIHAHKLGLQKTTILFSCDNGMYKGPIIARNITTGNEIEIRALTDCGYYGFNRGHVSSCINGNLSKHKKHTFRRINNVI